MVMGRVYWILGRKTFATYEDFVATVTTHNLNIDPEHNDWNPAQVISETPIRVVYEALWKNENDRINLLIGTAGVPVTMGQILFTLNNETYDFFAGGGSHFFEGLALINGTTYKLMVGS
jgi:hypothetical protein